jgi:uncharacterized protein (DUF1015 family)
VPRFEPFAALRYATSDLDRVIAPPYDVEDDLDQLERRHVHNIVHVDVPRERDGDGRYLAAAERLDEWVADGVLVRDEQPSFTLYRMRFVDAAGRNRQIVGVLGALEVVDQGAGGVLPHERTTPKASVLIADGHHRYSISHTYRDEVRSATGSDDTQAELTLAFVSELVADQLSVAAIHRVYRGIERSDLVDALVRGFAMSPAGQVERDTLAEMERRGALCLVDKDGSGTWLEPRPGVFDDVRALDGAWLEHVLADSGADVSYQHGVDELRQLVASDPTVTAGVLIRPVSVAEIERTAREGLLMPPKSTFFTPKLRTGLVLRELD